MTELSPDSPGSTLYSRSPTVFLGNSEFPLPASPLTRGRTYDYIRKRQTVAQPERGAIGYFLDCLTDIHYPGAFVGTVKLLNSLGFRVDAQFDSPCCGASALNTGDEKAFTKMATRYTRVFADAPYDRVLFSNPTCYKTVKERYPEILDDKELAHLPEPVLDVELYSQLLAPPLHPAWKELNIAWHNPCALGYALGDKTTAPSVLRKWGLNVSEFPDVEGCCGYGGMFYLRYPEFAAEQSTRKLRIWQDAGIDLALTCSAGCIGHINATAIRERIPIPTIHWGELS
jgi:L-lactate dehydrogenase complex protein LldE